MAAARWGNAPVFKCDPLMDRNTLIYQQKIYCGNDWAPHSPDLNPLDFHLWGFLKDRVYENSPKTMIRDLKSAIENKIQSIPHEQCKRVIDNFKQRIDVCIQRGGRHLEHVLRKS